MYNIKQAAARAGVSVPVLRAWERRYGIVHPARTASGYRLFDDESVERVRTMRSLVDEGWSPSSAAAAILAGTAPLRTVGQAASTDDREGVDRGEAPATSRDRAIAREIRERFVSAALRLDAAELDRVLDDLFSRGSFERVAQDLLFPALEDLGEAWSSGEVSVAGEHLASHAVLRRLSVALDAAGGGDGRGDRIIVGLPPGARHELGALAFAIAARRAGLAVAYLGPDLPVDDWAAAARGASAAVIGVVSRRDRRAAVEVAQRLRAADTGLIVAFGGRAAPAEPEVLVLPAGLTEAVAALSEALASRSA